MAHSAGVRLLSILTKTPVGRVFLVLTVKALLVLVSLTASSLEALKAKEEAGVSTVLLPQVHR